MKELNLNLFKVKHINDFVLITHKSIWIVRVKDGALMGGSLAENEIQAKMLEMIKDTDCEVTIEDFIRPLEKGNPKNIISAIHLLSEVSELREELETESAKDELDSILNSFNIKGLDED